MKKEKIIKRKLVYETELCESTEIDELLAILNHAKREHGAKEIEIYNREHHIGCGDYERDGSYLEFYADIEETDDEYDKRILAEKLAAEKLAIAAKIEEERKQRYVLEVEEKEKEKLRELMKKYPNIK